MKKIYYENKQIKEMKTKLLKTWSENDNFFVMLSDSIFYPQGGGQKGDKGYLIINNERFNVINTIKDEDYNPILILDKFVDEKYLDSDVLSYLDWDYRYKQMRLHTALHLYDYAIEKIKNEKLDYPLCSTIEDGFAYSKYEENQIDPILFDEITSLFKRSIKENHSVVTYDDPNQKNYRWWESMNYKMPCGGVHVDNLGEIGNVAIETYNKKYRNKKAITIKITLVD